MEVKKITTKSNLRKALHLYCLFLELVSAASFIYLTLFLHKNVYQTIIQTEYTLPDSQVQTLIEDVNMKKFNTVIENIKAKTKERKLEHYKNIF